jgi:hypothetical protein
VPDPIQSAAGWIEDELKAPYPEELTAAGKSSERYVLGCVGVIIAHLRLRWRENVQALHREIARARGLSAQLTDPDQCRPE